MNPRLQPQKSPEMLERGANKRHSSRIYLAPRRGLGLEPKHPYITHTGDVVQP